MAKPNLAEKTVLNPQEAIRHWGFSNRKFYRFLKETDGGDFLVHYGSRKLIIRVAFETYLNNNPKVKEELVNGEIRPWFNEER